MLQVATHNPVVPIEFEFAVHFNELSQHYDAVDSVSPDPPIVVLIAVSTWKIKR